MKNLSEAIYSELKETVYSDRYLNPEGFLNDIKDKIEEAKNILGVDNDILVDDGAIFYMNGNDSTPFDWEVNGRTCEFMTFYKDGEMGMCKVWISKDGKLEGYCFNKEDINTGIPLTSKDIVDQDDAADFAYLCARVADDNKLWDKNIEDIPWDDVKVSAGTGKYYLGDE